MGCHPWYIHFCTTCNTAHAASLGYLMLFGVNVISRVIQINLFTPVWMHSYQCTSFGRGMSTTKGARKNVVCLQYFEIT